MSYSPLQLSLNGLVAELRRLPSDMEVHLPGSGMLTVPSALRRHRRSLPDMAISAIPSRYGPMLARQLADLYENGGQVHGGGGEIISDENRSAPLWTSPPGGEATFVAVTGLEIRKGVAVIKTTNMAITQGPSLQRLTDEESLLRQLTVIRTRIPDFDEAATPAQQWLLRNTPRERSNTLQRLTVHRQELAGLSARRAELEASITEAAATVAELDYILGITDELSPAAITAKEQS